MAKATHLVLYGVIGDPTDGLDAKTVTTAIRAATGDIRVSINSPGGFITEGLAIYSALVAYDGGKVNVEIDGLAASMASVIAMAGDTIAMAENALMMIHNPWDSPAGDAGELRKAADKLDLMKTRLVGMYAARTSLPEGELASMMDAETWMTADEALARGFITTINAPLKMAAMADVSAFGFRHLPASLKGPVNVTEIVTDPMNAAQVIEIRALGKALGVPDAVVNGLFVRKLNPQDARDAMLEHLADAGDALNIGHTGAAPRMGADVGTLDDPAFHGKAVGEVLYARLSGKTPQGAALELMGTPLVELAREMIVRQGVRNATRLNPYDVLNASAWGSGQTQGGRTWLSSPRGAITHTTGDFPSLMLSASQKFLMDSYQAAESALKTVARQREAKDFRALYGVQLSNFGVLGAVNEAGEIKSGTFNDRQEKYALTSYGKMFSISRQALINDDLGAFHDVLNIMGRASAETEAQAMVALLNSNPVMSDGNALFSAAHGNVVAAGAGAAPDVPGLSAMRLAMRTRLDGDGVTIINATPKYLVVPAALETTANILTAAAFNLAGYTTFGATNPFVGAMAPLVEPRLADAHAWYGFADPNVTPGLEYAYLQGSSGPITESQPGWNILGMEYRVYHDFGCGVMGYNGTYRNAGQ